MPQIILELEFSAPPPFPLNGLCPNGQHAFYKVASHIPYLKWQGVIGMKRREALMIIKKDEAEKQLLKEIELIANVQDTLAR